MVLIRKRNMQNNFSIKKSRKNLYISAVQDMAFGSVPVSFRCTFLRCIECFLLRKNIWNKHEKRFTMMMPLSMSHGIACNRLWRHNCFSNSIQFELIYFISIYHYKIKIQTFLYIRKRNKFLDHPLYISLERDLFAAYSNMSLEAKNNVATKTYQFGADNSPVQLKFFF